MSMLAESKNNSRVTTYVDALREAVGQEMERDASVLVFGLDVDDHKGIQGSTRGLLERFGSSRVFTIGRFKVVSRPTSSSKKSAR